MSKSEPNTRKIIVMKPRYEMSMLCGSSEIGTELDLTSATESILVNGKPYLVRFRILGSPRKDLIVRPREGQRPNQLTFDILWERIPRMCSKKYQDFKYSKSSDGPRVNPDMIRFAIDSQRREQLSQDESVRVFKFGPRVEELLMEGKSPQEICTILNKEESQALQVCSIWHNPEGYQLATDLIRHILDFLGHKGNKRGGKKSYKKTQKKNKTKKYRK